jgi:hypothetical protein
MYGERKMYLLIFLTSSLDECEWSALNYGHLTTGEAAASAFWKFARPCNQIGRCDEQIKFFPLSGSESQFIRCPTHSLFVVLIDLY